VKPVIRRRRRDICHAVILFHAVNFVGTEKRCTAGIVGFCSNVPMFQQGIYLVFQNYEVKRLYDAV
jgi:hypothetical protein